MTRVAAAGGVGARRRLALGRSQAEPANEGEWG